MRSDGALARLAEVAARARPVALAREQVLPVLPPLETLLPDGLRRGSTGAVGGSTALAPALVAGPARAGSWGAGGGGAGPPARRPPGGRAPPPPPGGPPRPPRGARGAGA